MAGRRWEMAHTGYEWSPCSGGATAPPNPPRGGGAAPPHWQWAYGHWQWAYDYWQWAHAHFQWAYAHCQCATAIGSSPVWSRRDFQSCPVHGIESENSGPEIAILSGRGWNFQSGPLLEITESNKTPCISWASACSWPARVGRAGRNGD